MRKIFTALLIAGLLSTIGIVFASGNPGAIWTTNADCGDITQDVNHYPIGGVVYINGANFDPGTYDWSITGQPGGASCDPGQVVASGQVNVGQTGNFCFAAYTVAADDCGEYSVKVGNKGDNYNVEAPIPPTPTETQPVPPTPTETQPVPPTPTGTQPIPPTPTGTQPIPPTPTGTQPIPPTPTGTQPIPPPEPPELQPVPCVAPQGCGPHVDEEQVCSGKVGMVSNWWSWLFGKGYIYHLWSDSHDFIVKNLITGESVTAPGVTTPAGTRWVVNTNWVFFRVYDQGNQIFDLCKKQPCAVSGWSYVNGTILAPYWPYNQSELAAWFFQDPLFKTSGDWIAADAAATEAMKALKIGEPFDLAPYLAP